MKKYIFAVLLFSGLVALAQLPKPGSGSGGSGGNSAPGYGAYASLSATCVVGDQYFTSDSVYNMLCTATNTWTPFLGGLKTALPSTSGYSWSNQETSTISTALGYWHIEPEITDGGWDIRRFTRALPTKPYRYSACFTATNYVAAVFGVVLSDNSDASRGYSWDQGINTPKLNIAAYASDTSASYVVSPQDTTVVGLGGLVCLAVRDDNAGTRYYEISRDYKRTWAVFYSESSTATITPTKVGLYTNNNAAAAFDIYDIDVQ